MMVPLMENLTGSFTAWSLMSAPFSMGFEVTLLDIETASLWMLPMVSGSNRTEPLFRPVMVYAMRCHLLMRRRS